MIWDDFLWFGLAGGLGVALVSGPMGCFIIWRRMAYFGDTLAHSALLGIALGLLLEINLTAGILAACIAVSLSLFAMQSQQHLAVDTLLGIFSHAALAVGLVTLSLMENIRVDLMGYLFGDILSVTATELAWVYGGGTVLLVVLIRLWRPLLAITVHSDLAAAEGIAVKKIRLIFMLLIAAIVAISMKIIGILLITSLLIIPAAAARQFCRTPEQMAVLASILGCLSVIGGLWSSLQWDTPSGPSIVVVAAVLFAFSLMIGSRVRMP